MKMAPTAVVVALATLSARSMLTMIPKIFGGAASCGTFSFPFPVGFP